MNAKKDEPKQQPPREQERQLGIKTATDG